MSGHFLCYSKYTCKHAHGLSSAHISLSSAPEPEHAAKTTLPVLPTLCIGKPQAKKLLYDLHAHAVQTHHIKLRRKLENRRQPKTNRRPNNCMQPFEPHRQATCLHPNMVLGSRKGRHGLFEAKNAYRRTLFGRTTARPCVSVGSTCAPKPRPNPLWSTGRIVCLATCRSRVRTPTFRFCFHLF